MDEADILRCLRSLLYQRLYRTHIDTLSTQYVESLKSAYGTEFDDLRTALAWAASHPDFPYASSLNVGEMTDSRIYEYFCALRQVFDDSAK